MKNTDNATIKSVLLWENQRRYIREAFNAGTLKGAIVPTGSTEQHNEHLAMEHDTASALSVSKLAAEKLFPEAIVTTPIALGVAEHWMHHKGTLTLRPEIFGEVLYDVCDSLRRHGIKNVLIINGHAGNNGPARERIDGFRERLGINLLFHSYWDAYTQEFIEEHLDSGHYPGHAAEFETSIAMAAFPENVDWDGVDYDAADLPSAHQTDSEHDRTYHQEAKLATAAKGKLLIDVAVDWVADKLQQMISESEN
ncbi:MAG: creatininase family protein [Planctomycetota bacterium]|jgi:creatinine amidohydrolase|nr:creatininase family protein [Planctomycetota bacterium]MDP7129790.1 creatininase family protein [Planctomycetota bacterium]MDP7248208.1 creatininase family protein [Planctomycetota bacterium]